MVKRLFRFICFTLRTCPKSISRLLVCIAVCAGSRIFCMEEPLQPLEIRSNEAEYNGHEVVLKGDVFVQHEAGKLFAKEIHLLKDSAKKGRLSSIELAEDVRIEWSRGGVLFCDKAKIDCLLLNGLFYSKMPERQVTYNECVSKSKSNEAGQAILSIKSNQMQVELKKEGAPQSQNQALLISNIAATENVVINYADNYCIQADRASYHRSRECQAEKKIAGHIYVEMNSQDKTCTVMHGLDKILARTITVDTLNRQILFWEARGELIASQAAASDGAVEFFAKQMSWDDTLQKLVMQGDVSIFQKGFGKLTTQDSVEVIQHEVDGKKIIKTIFIPQNTILTYFDSEKGQVHTLTCFGPLTVDHERLQVDMEAPLDQSGRACADKQIFFEDRFGNIYADRAKIFYVKSDGQLVPNKIVLEGHVKILSCSQKNEGISEQYALADKIEYMPTTKEMLLSSEKGKRVLFFDSANNMQMSAPALKVKRDQMTKKDSIQGIGDVRFSFVESEFEQLKQKFQFVQPKDVE